MTKQKGFAPMFRRAANVPKGSRCVYCGGWAQLVEHVIPDLKPYPLPWNERYACSVCNVVKARKQQRGIKVNELLALLEKRPDLHKALASVPVGMEAGDDDNYDWYYRRFKPSLSWMSNGDWSVISQVALALYEADIPIRNSIARYQAAR